MRGRSSSIILSQSQTHEQRKCGIEDADLDLVPRVRSSFGQHQEHGLWPLPRREVRKSRTSSSSTHAQKIETTVVFNGYKNGPSLRGRINWRWPESVFLMLTKRKAEPGDERKSKRNKKELVLLFILCLLLRSSLYEKYWRTGILFSRFLPLSKFPWTWMHLCFQFDMTFRENWLSFVLYTGGSC